MFSRKYEISGKSADGKQIPVQIRNRLGLKQGEQIDMKHIPFVSDFYNKKFNTNYTYMVTDINGIPYEKFSTFTGFEPKKKNQKTLTKEQIKKQKQKKQIYLSQLAYCSRDENGNIIGPLPKIPTPKKNEKKEILNEIQTSLDNCVIICYTPGHYSSCSYIIKSKQKCQLCGSLFLEESFENHKCNPTRFSNYEKIVKKAPFVMHTNARDKKEFDYKKNLMALDFETSPFENDYPDTLTSVKIDGSSKKKGHKKSKFDDIDKREERKAHVYACGILWKIN